MDRETGILECFKENWSHARHVEIERLSFTQFYTMTIGVAAAAVLQWGDKFTPLVQGALVFVIFIVSLFGLELSHRWGKTFDTHMVKASKAAHALGLTEFVFKHSGYNRFTWRVRTRFLFCYYYGFVLMVTGTIFMYLFLDLFLAHFFGAAFRAELLFVLALVAVCLFFYGCCRHTLPPIPGHMEHRLLALDLDGTLLDKDHNIPESTIHKIRLAQEHGVLVTLATGRMWPSARIYAEELKITDPLIAYNGALIRALSSDSTDYFDHISIDVMRDVINYCKSENLYLQLYINDEIVVETCVEETYRDPDYKYARCREVGDFEEYLRSSSAQPTPKMLVRLPLDLESQKVAQIKRGLERNSPQLQVMQSSSASIELLPPQVSKGLALKRLAERLGIAQYEVVAVGDADNDISMIEWAGLGVSVQNGSNNLRKAADYITTQETYLGVEEVIDKYILSPGGRTNLKGTPDSTTKRICRALSRLIAKKA